MIHTTPLDFVRVRSVTTDPRPDHRILRTGGGPEMTCRRPTGSPCDRPTVHVNHVPVAHVQIHRCPLRSLHSRQRCAVHGPRRPVPEP